MQTLNIDLDYEVKVIGKTFTLLKQKDIILNSMTQTREKWDSLVSSRGDFWMIWRYHGILCIHVYFLFRNNVWREQLDKNNFCHCYSFFFCFFFENTILKVLDYSYVQSSFSTITRHFDNSIWKTPCNWRFYEHGCQACTKAFNLLLYASHFLKHAYFLSLN